VDAQLAMDMPVMGLLLADCQHEAAEVAVVWIGARASGASFTTAAGLSGDTCRLSVDLMLCHADRQMTDRPVGNPLNRGWLPSEKSRQCPL
jgi:hypothetical protein